MQSYNVKTSIQHKWAKKSSSKLETSMFRISESWPRKFLWRWSKKGSSLYILWVVLHSSMVWLCTIHGILHQRHLALHHLNSQQLKIIDMVNLRKLRIWVRWGKQLYFTLSVCIESLSHWLAYKAMSSLSSSFALSRFVISLGLTVFYLNISTF